MKMFYITIDTTDYGESDKRKNPLNNNKNRETKSNLNDLR